MNKYEAIDVLRRAQKILERNAHLVKKGDPRDDVCTAISMLADVKHWLITNEALEPVAPHQGFDTIEEKEDSYR